MTLAVVFYTDPTTSGEHWTAGTSITSATISRSTVSIWRRGQQHVIARRVAGNGQWRITETGDRYNDVLIATPGVANRVLGRRAGARLR